MIQISKSDFENLRKAGLVRFTGDKNYTITNKKKRGKQKKYYIVEERAVLAFLNRKKEY